MHFTFIATVATVVANAAALGINCRGSSFCAINNYNSAATELVAMINTIPDNRWFRDGEEIACYSGGFIATGICAFLQNTKGSWGYQIKAKAHYITDHGCRVCGSVPMLYPQQNNVKKGELTFNYKSWTPCLGFYDVKRVCRGIHRV